MIMSLQDQIEAIESAEFVPIGDMDEWQTWLADNRDALDMDEKTALQLAMNCELLIGGGAAPLFRIGFVD